jgi:hypothetical protein
MDSNKKDEEKFEYIFQFTNLKRLSDFSEYVRARTIITSIQTFLN